MTVFAEKIRMLRAKHNLSQSDLAKICGNKQASASKWETGENSYPSVKALLKIADYFHVSLDYLVRDEIPPEGVYLTNSYVKGSVVQSNVHGDINLNNSEISKQATELARIYEKLDIRSQNEILNLAFKLEDKQNEKSGNLRSGIDT